MSIERDYPGVYAGRGALTIESGRKKSGRDALFCQKNIPVQSRSHNK